MPSTSLAIVRSTAIPGTLRSLPAFFCLFLALAGCHSQGVAASHTGESSVGDSSSTGNGVSTVILKDASFDDMNAAAVSVPEHWHSRGEVITAPCTHLPSVAWETASPNGESRMYVLRQFGWKWGGNISYAQQGCIPLQAAMSAADFLQAYISRLPDVKTVGTMPIAEAYRQRVERLTGQLNANQASFMSQIRTHSTGDIAAVRAVTSNGQEMRLRAWTECAAGTRNGNCFARVDILVAPKGKLDALASLVDSKNLIQERPTQEYMAAFMNRQRQVGDQQMSQLRQQERAGDQQMEQLRKTEQAGDNAIHQQYLDSSARLNAEHQAGMDELQRSTQSSMNNATNSMNARSTSASDWRDYAADQQTVSGANGTYKTSSAYTNVWSSPVGPALSDGRSFGSTDNTVDPNTATDNTWTKDTKVHGNGQPY